MKEHFAQTDKDKIANLKAASLKREPQDQLEDFKRQLTDLYAVMINARKEIDAAGEKVLDNKHGHARTKKMSSKN